MGQVLHGSATTTETIRRAIQNSQESIRVLAQRYNINPKTVAKWKKRTTVKDHAMGPKQKQSTVLTSDEEAVIVAFRKQTLLPLPLMAYNFARRLKTLNGLTAYEFICPKWQQHPDRFLFDPSHLILGLYT